MKKIIAIPVLLLLFFSIGSGIADTYGQHDSVSQIITGETVLPPIADAGDSYVSSVNRKPVADAGLDQMALVDRTVYFDGSASSDPDGSIMSWTWDFGDGETALGETVSHKYSEPGNYTGILTVKDNREAQDSDKCEVIVWEWPAPVANKFGQLVPGEQKGFKVDASEAANTIVTLDTTDDVTVTVLKYDDNPHPDDPLPATALPIYVDVEVSDPDAVEWPIYVEMFYTDEEIGNLDESTFGIYYWMDGEWHRCSHTGVDMERNVVWAYMTAMEASGSPILIGGVQQPEPEPLPPLPTPPLPPLLSDLIITPLEVDLGEMVTISFVITNINDQIYIYNATIWIGEITLLVDVELDAYESEIVTRTLTPETEGTYDVTIDGITDTFTVKPPLKTTEFKASDLTVSPIETEKRLIVSPRYVSGILIIVVTAYLLYRYAYAHTSNL